VNGVIAINAVTMMDAISRVNFAVEIIAVRETCLSCLEVSFPLSGLHEYP
jgi:hypothetical protein